MRIPSTPETPKGAKVARDFGAEGIGLCRTEHMFFAEDRIAAIRKMILARTVEARKAALTKLLPFQRKDFKEIFDVMRGLPVTIRLLDPPLHEFLPQSAGDISKLAGSMGISAAALSEVVEIGRASCRERV